MKRYSLVFLAIFSVLSLSSTAFAANNNAFYVSNAYFKGDGKYDVVVHDPKRETLQIYVNGKKSVKAKVNKKGFATFQKVKLSGQSKLTFKKSKSVHADIPIKYVKYIQVDSAQVKLSDTGPKHTYDEFYKWANGQRYDAMMAPVGSAYQQIMSSCGSRDRNFGSAWTACMQAGYKDYLKPETFIGDNWMGDYSTMVGYMNSAGTEVAKYGTVLVQKQSSHYGKDMQEAQKIYDRLAATN